MVRGWIGITLNGRCHGLKSWMAANNTVIMAVLLLIIGVKLLGDGISGL